MTQQLREKLWRVIFKSDTRKGKQFDVLLLIAILVSILAVVLESIELLNQEYKLLFKISEWVITGIFSVEYLIRIWVVRDRKKYVFSFYGIIDFLSILPTYLGLIFVGSHSLLVIRAIRLIRVFRIFKLTRYTKAANTIASALKASMVKISVFLFAVLMLVLIIGTAMYLIEGKQNGFENIPKSIYWAIITLSTVGYGDVVPHTILGQIFAGIVMITGYGIIAVPTGIVTAQVIYEQQVKKRVKCINCGETQHDPEAKYCKTCGQDLPIVDS